MKRILLISVFLAATTAVMALNPSRKYAAKPGDFGLNYEEVSIQTEDNVTLKGWLYKPATPTFNMIVISDDGDGNMADMIEIASNFVSLGFNVLTYDYRGYGESDEFTINNNFYIYAQFEKDLQGAINYVRKYHSKMKVLDLYGVGIGGALSIAVGANRTEVFQVVADSPYSTLEGIKKRIKEKRNLDVLLPLGFNKYLLEPYYALETKGTSLYGVLFICGEYDDLVTPDDIKDLMKLQKNRGSSYIVKGVNGSETFSKDKNKYFEMIRDFIKFPN
jgi:dienelactone hydrolase